MLIDFNTFKEITISGLNGGSGSVSAKMSPFSGGKVMTAKIPAGAGIGMHRHETSVDINYVISGTGRALCGEAEELLSPGTCHICPVGSSHCIENTGSDDLVLFTAVYEI